MDRLTDKVKRLAPWAVMFADDIVICVSDKRWKKSCRSRRRFAITRGWKWVEVKRNTCLEMRVWKGERQKAPRTDGSRGNKNKVPTAYYARSGRSTKKKEPQERKRAGWNGWRRVSRVIIDWRTAAEPAVMYSSKTVGLSERQWPGWTGLQMSGSEGQLFSTYRSDIQLESQSEDGLCVGWGQGRRWDFGTGGHQTCQLIFA